MKSCSRRLVFLVVLSLLTAFGFLGARGIYETSEGRYTECAREMVESGNYLEPTLGYRPHWTKPPLTYWAVAAGIRIFDGSEWGARFFSAMALLATIGLVYALGRMLWGPDAGIVAGIVYATSPLPIFGAFSVTTDTFLTLFEVAAVFCYLKARFGGAGMVKRLGSTGMWLFLGLGFLTKGPPALLPLAPIILWHMGSGSPFRLFKPLDLLLFAATALSWYIAAWIRHPELLDYFIGVEVVGRLTSDAGHNSEWYKPFTLYFPVLFLGTAPWIVFMLRPIRHRGLQWIRSFPRQMKSGDPGTFLLLWIGIPFVVFCLAKSRLPLYLLPLMAPVTLGIARSLTTGDARTVPFSRLATVACITAVVLVGAKAGSAFIPNANNMAQLYARILEISDEDTRVRSYCPQKLYGLQYYRNGRLQRISVSGEEPWADLTFKEMVDSIKRFQNPEAYVFIATKHSHPALKRVFDDYSIPYHFYPGRFWMLYRIEKGTGTSSETIAPKVAGSVPL